MNRTAVKRRLDALESELDIKRRRWGVAFQRDGHIEFDGACYVRNEDLPHDEYERFIIVCFVASDGAGGMKKEEPKDYGNTFRGRLLREAAS